MFYGCIRPGHIHSYIFIYIYIYIQLRNMIINWFVGCYVGINLLLFFHAVFSPSFILVDSRSTFSQNPFIVSAAIHLVLALTPFYTSLVGRLHSKLILMITLGDTWCFDEFTRNPVKVAMSKHRNFFGWPEHVLYCI